jgi:hypothetical protein
VVDDMPETADSTAESTDRLTTRMDFSVDAAVVALAVWTGVFHVSVFLSLHRDLAMSLWILACALLLWLVLRRPGPARMPATTWSVPPFDRVHLGGGLVVALMLAFLEPDGRAWPNVWVLTVAMLGYGLWVMQRGERTGPATAQSGHMSLAVRSVLLLALLAALLSLVMVRPDRDDVYVMNRAAWVEEHATSFPTRDTIFSDDVLPTQRPAGPQTSFEPLIGSIAAWLPFRAAAVGYLGVAPLVAALGVLALWRLLRTLGARAPSLACWVGTIWLVLDGTMHRSFGNFAMGRSWQGKVVLVAVVVPVLWHHAIAFGRSGSRRHLLMLLAGSLAGVGLSSSAVLVVSGVVVAGVAAGAVVARRPHRMFTGLVALAPPAIAASWIVLAEPQRLEAAAPVLAYLGGIVTLDSEVEPIAQIRYVFGDGATAVVPLVAVLLGSLAVGRREGRLALALASVTVFGFAFAPGALDLLSDLAGSESVLWRVIWILPVPAMVGAVLTSIPVSWPERPTAHLLLPAGALGLILVLGTPITSAANRGAALAWPPRYELPWPDQLSAPTLAGLAPDGGLVAGPSTVDFAVSVLTTRVKTVNPRPHYLQGRHVDESFGAAARLTLSTALERGIAEGEANRLGAAIEQLRPAAVCHRLGVSGALGTVLEEQGYERVDDDGYCVFWTR